MELHPRARLSRVARFRGQEPPRRDRPQWRRRAELVPQLPVAPAARSAKGVLLKLLHNPVESPDEPKFRKVKLANKRIAAVLEVAGGEDRGA